MKKDDALAEALRGELAQQAKSFKTSWVQLGQGLYAVWRDKMFRPWGHEKFEDYVVRELGLQKALAMKLVKTYFFVEQEEPVYLKEDFSQTREAPVVPGYDSLDLLRLAHRHKGIERSEYVKLRKDVFEKGRGPAAVRKDLTAIIKERKQVDPDEEREARHQRSVKKLLAALKSFTQDMEALNLIEADITEDAEGLLKKLEAKYA